jgi:hypothetical protein
VHLLEKKRCRTYELFTVICHVSTSFVKNGADVGQTILRCKWISAVNLYIFLPISVKFATEDLDVILYRNVEFRKIQYIEDCKKVSKPLLVCYKFLVRSG